MNQKKRQTQWLKRDRSPNQIIGRSAVQVSKKRLPQRRVYAKKFCANACGSDECASERARAVARWLWRAMRPGSKFNRLASRWLGVMTTCAAGSTSANWGQPCQTTAIGCWETNVVVLPSTVDGEEFGSRNREKNDRAATSLILVTNYDTTPEKITPCKI